MNDAVIIGNAILYHADCRDVLPTLNDVQCVITDPPYNVGKDYGTWNDNLPDEEYELIMQDIVELCLALSEKQVWVAPRYKMHFWTGLLPGAHLVVIRRGASGCLRGGWADQFETLLAIGKPNRTEKDLWEDIRLVGEGYFFREERYGHPGYTPSKIMARSIGLMTNDGDTVCDPFMGTGTTGTECARMGRKFIGIEISEEYFQISCERIKQEYDQLKMF